MNRSIILPALVTAFVALSPAGVALADNPHARQPEQPPANRTRAAKPAPDATAPGFGTAGSPMRRQHYAGETARVSEHSATATTP